MNDGNTRTLLVRVDNLSNSPTGVAYFGFGPDIEDADGTEISGMICNWAGPGFDHTLKPYMQKQTFAGAGWDFEPLESSITYAPLNDCETDDPAFHHYTTDSSEMANDHFGGDAVTLDLETYDASVLPSPSAPTDIDN
jgi:hypothetical protein